MNTLAVGHMNCKLGDVEANPRRMNDLAGKIKRREVDVLCFPELVTTGYSLGQEWVDLAEPITGPRAVCVLVEQDQPRRSDCLLRPQPSSLSRMSHPSTREGIGELCCRAT